MIIIHHVMENTLPRLVVPSLEQRLRVMPAVIVTGARQTGKSTLARELTWGNDATSPLTTLTFWTSREGTRMLSWAVNSPSRSMRCSVNPTC